MEFTQIVDLVSGNENECDDVCDVRCNIKYSYK